MAQRTPYTNFHDLNLDWIIKRIKNVYTDENPPPYPVESVNGKTGVVVLTGTDIPVSTSDSTPVSTELAEKYSKPASGIPASDLAPGVIPDPASVIDDNAGSQVYNKTWSAHKLFQQEADILDLQNDKQDAPASAGTAGQVLGLNSSLQPEWVDMPEAQMIEAVDDWLSENITNPSNPPLDRSLSLSNACAPADLVGDLKNDLNTLVNTQSISATGQGSYYMGFQIKAGNVYRFTGTTASNISVATIDANNTTIENVGNINASTSIDFTATLDAPKILFYFRGAGSATVEEKGLIVEQLQTDIEILENDTEALNNRIDSLDEIIYRNIDRYSETYESGAAVKTYKWISTILPPNARVTDYKQLVTANATNIVYLELWEYDEENNVYTLSRTLTATSSTKDPESNYYTLTFPPFITTKKTLLTYSDASSLGWLRYARDPESVCQKFASNLTSVTSTDISETPLVKLAYQIQYILYRPKGKCTSVVYVDINGSGQYTSVADAVAQEPEGTIIYILPGVYNGTVQAFNKRIVLIGTDRNKCIIRSTSGNYSYPAINGACGYLENLTILSEYVSGESEEIDNTTSGAYALHCESEYGVGNILELHHCNLKSDFFPALGAGLRKDFHLVLDDCFLENNQVSGRGNYSTSGSLGALYFHDSNGSQGNQYITVKNCILKSKLGKTMTPYQVSREPQNNHVYCDFIGNVLYDAINKYSNNIWYRNDPFNPSTGIFEIGIGYGNSNSGLNNN